MRVATWGEGGTAGDGERRLSAFLASSLVAHGAGLALLLAAGAGLAPAPARPLAIRLVPPPGAAPAAPPAPAGPPPAGVPRAEAPRRDAPPELVEAPKPSVEQTPRSKRFAGLYDRRGGPGAPGSVRDSTIVPQAPPRPPGGTLRGEEKVRPPALPPAEPAPSKPAPKRDSPAPAPGPAVSVPATPPAQPASGSPAPAPREITVAKAEPLPPGRTAIVQSAAPPAAIARPSPPTPGPAPGAPQGQGGRAGRPSLRDQVASLGPLYRPPVEDSGTAGDAGGRGEPGLETFRFKYATWGLAVKRDIERAWKVPRYGMASMAVVRFLVLPDGRIRDLQVEKTSGLASLDKAATEAITDAAPFRPFPPRMREENPGGIDITVNFYYQEGRGVLQWE